MGRVVGVNGLLLRFFDNGFRILGFESGTLVEFILVAWSIVVKCEGDDRGLIWMGNLCEITSNDFAYYVQIHVKKEDGPIIPYILVPMINNKMIPTIRLVIMWFDPKNLMNTNVCMNNGTWLT